MAAFLIWAVAGALLLIGAGAVIAPKFSASQYGLTPDGPVAVSFVQAMGARDVVLGLMILAASRAPPETGVQRTMIGLVGLVAAADFLIVLKRRGRSGLLSAALHGGGVVGLAVVWVRLGRVD